MSIVLKITLVKEFTAWIGNREYEQRNEISYFNDRFKFEESLITLCKNRFMNVVKQSCKDINSVRFFLDYESRKINIHQNCFYRGVNGTQNYRSFYIIVDFNNIRSERLSKINGSIDKLTKNLKERGDEIYGFAKIQSIEYI